MIDLLRCAVGHRQKESFIIELLSVSFSPFRLGHLSFGSAFCLYTGITQGAFKNTWPCHLTIN